MHRGRHRWLQQWTSGRPICGHSRGFDVLHGPPSTADDLRDRTVLDCRSRTWGTTVSERVVIVVVIVVHSVLVFLTLRKGTSQEKIASFVRVRKTITSGHAKTGDAPTYHFTIYSCLSHYKPFGELLVGTCQYIKPIFFN